MQDSRSLWVACFNKLGTTKLEFSCPFAPCPSFIRVLPREAIGVGVYYVSLMAERRGSLTSPGEERPLPSRDRTRALQSRRPHPLALRWVVLGVIGGFFAMHGLGAHALHDVHGESPVARADSAASAPHGALPAESDAVVEDEALGAPDPARAALVGVCLAVLSVLMLMWRRGVLVRLSRLHATASWGRRVASPARARLPAPPIRSQICIWRC